MITSSSRSSQSHPVAPAAMEFQSLLGRLLSQRCDGGPPRVAAITSSERGAGVTTVATHLATIASQQATSPILLVDANFTNPTLSIQFAPEAGPGLSDLLAEKCPLEVAIQETTHTNLALLTAGRAAHNLRSIAEVEVVRELFQELRQRHPLVVLDLPSVSSAGITLPLAAAADGVLLVVNAEKARRDETSRAKDLLQQSHATVLGAVLNKRRRPHFWQRRQSEYV